MTAAWTGDHFVNSDIIVSYSAISSDSPGSGVASYSLWGSSTPSGPCDTLIASGITAASYNLTLAQLPSNGSSRNYCWGSIDNAGNVSGLSSPNYINMDTTAPTVPSVNAIPASINQTSLSVSSALASDAGVGGVQYQFCYNTENNPNLGCTLSSWANTPEANLTGLLRGNGYYVFVRVRDALANTSIWSSPVNTYVMTLTPTATPIVTTSIPTPTPTAVPINNANQYKYETDSLIAIGQSLVDSDKVVLKNITTNTTQIELTTEFEVKLTGKEFDGVTNIYVSNSSLNTSGSVFNSVSINSLQTGSYHWRFRVVDSTGIKGIWQYFGSNSESEADFAVLTKTPVVTVTLFQTATPTLTTTVKPQTLPDLIGVSLPTVQQIQKIAKNQETVTTAVVSTGVVTTVSILSYLDLFKFVITPWFKRKRYWGLIYDNSNGVPIPLAVVRAFSAADNSIKAETVSDFEGRYLMILDPGSYKFTVEHPEYIVTTKDEDPGSYKGEVIRVSDTTNMDLNMAMEKSGNPKTDLLFSLKIILHRIAEIFGSIYVYLVYLFLVINLVFLIVSPSTTYLMLVVYHLIVIGIYYYFGNKYKKQWSLVFNSLNGKPISKCIIKLYDEKDGASADTKITDSSGRFQVILPKGSYRIVASAEGFSFPSKTNRVYQNSSGQVVIVLNNKTLKRELPMDPSLEKFGTNKFALQ